MGLVVFVVVFIDEAFDFTRVDRRENVGSQSQFDLNELLWSKFSELRVKLKNILTTQ